MAGLARSPVTIKLQQKISMKQTKCEEFLKLLFCSIYVEFELNIFCFRHRGCPCPDMRLPVGD